MSAIYLPGPVGVFVRRLVNVVATLSISNQYLLARKAELQSKDRPLRAVEREGNEGPRLSNTFEGEATSLAPDAINSPHLLRTGPLESTPAPMDHKHEVPLESSTYRNPPEPRPSDRKPDEPPESQETIHRLMSNPALYEPVRKPRYPIVLCHGLYGFDVRGPSSFPSLQLHYWSSVLSILRNVVGAEVIVAGVPPTGSVISRSERLHDFLKTRALGRAINFFGHSMGGLDCRHLITHIQPTEYTPVSLTTISTPHRGSPFMDWCKTHIGLGKARPENDYLPPTASFTPFYDPSDPEHRDTSSPSRADDPPKASSAPKGKSASDGPTAAQTATAFSLSALPSSFTTLLLSVFDSPAYSNLTTAYLRDTFNPSTPDDPRVKYFSVAGRTPGMSVWHPLWLPKMVLDQTEDKERGALARTTDLPPPSAYDYTGLERATGRAWGNDGLVSVESAKWGEFLGTLEGVDHWEIRGARGIGLEFSSSFGKSESSSLSEGWNWRDWARFVGAWNREAKRREAADAGSQAQASSSQQEPATGGGAGGTESEKARKERDRLDGILRSSTHKLSAVVDWISEQTPSMNLNIRSPAVAVNALNALGRVVGATASKEERDKVDVASKRKEPPPPKRNDLASKQDLERFYVALSRKLYDEGL